MGASIDGFSYEEMESIWLDFDKHISDMYNLSDRMRHRVGYYDFHNDDLICGFVTFIVVCTLSLRSVSPKLTCL